MPPLEGDDDLDGWFLAAALGAKGDDGMYVYMAGGGVRKISVYTSICIHVQYTHICTYINKKYVRNR